MYRRTFKGDGSRSSPQHMLIHLTTAEDGGAIIVVTDKCSNTVATITVPEHYDGKIYTVIEKGETMITDILSDGETSEPVSSIDWDM